MTIALTFLLTYNIVTVQELWNAFISGAREKIIDLFLEELAPNDDVAQALKRDLIRSMQNERFRFFFLDPESDEIEFLHHEVARASDDLKTGEVLSFVRVCISYDFPKNPPPNKDGRPKRIIGEVQSLPDFSQDEYKFRKTAERLLV